MWSITDKGHLTTNEGNVITGYREAHKNQIIDGNFNFWYEGTTQTTTGYGSDTMWLNANIGSTKVHNQYVLTDAERALVGFETKYGSETIATSVAGVGNNCSKYQAIEHSKTLAGKTVTLSFYAKADASKNMAIEIAQNFGSGGGPSAAVDGIGSQLIALTTTLTKYSVQIAIPSIAGKTLGTDLNDGLYLNFWFDAGSNFDTRTASLGQQSGTFVIANVQLEEGVEATSFDDSKTYSDLGVHRFYENSFNKGTVETAGLPSFHKQATALSASVLDHSLYFTTEKRSIPTLTFLKSSDGAGANSTWAYYIAGWTSGAVGTVDTTTKGTGARLSGSALTANMGYPVSGNWSADARF